MWGPVSPTDVRMSICAALLVVACGAPQATPSAPAPASTHAAPPRTGEPIAEYVVAAYTDSKGVLWFGTIGKGVARYDGERFTYLSPAGGRGGDVVASIAEDARGDLWFGGHDGTGVCRYDGTTFTQLREGESRVSADRRGNIWVGTNRDGVYRVDGDALVEFPLPLPAAADLPYTIVAGRASMALEDSRGHLWFQTDGHGAVRFDGREFTQFTRRDGLCSDTAWSVVEDRQGRLWFACVQAFQPRATGDGGLVRYDGRGFTAFPGLAGLAGNDIYTLHVDRAGDVWIGATGVGVYRHHDEAFTLFDRTDRPDLNGGFGLQAMT